MAEQLIRRTLIQSDQYWLINTRLATFYTSLLRRRI